MKVGEIAGMTDAGRKRLHNEDAFLIEPPLFAVADGMGGAQAGEVASQLATSVVRESHAGDDLVAEERLAAIIREANRAIFERAQSDVGASGMGTTITAALLVDDVVAIGHVGDSRAYVLRDGGLQQLTEDHSLVADLIRSGRLTPQEAEVHPQRALITRALGTDLDVEVDTLTIEVRPGDVILLCSDGLTTMVDDIRIVELIAAASSLEEAARGLLRAANERGGEDNITVVLFGLQPAGAERIVSENGQATVSQQGLEDTLSGLEIPAELEAPLAEETAVFQTDERPGWPEPPSPPRSVVRPPVPVRPLPPEPEGSRWAKRLIVLFAAIALALTLVAVAFWGVSRANFVGADDSGFLTVYRGLPWDLGGGVELYRARYVSRVHASQLSPRERAELFDHDLTSYADARERVRRFEEEAVP